eukprot:gnl/Chilomastix_cuspidata/1588.p1 GENE.gnl/Chilomastix_cuspidata/1588~~gnl/Chilomastix_cuspidata/1588.p1  ORF type:complete len:589 (-),score=84.16 gnl/Chilomastix_cuspidata/1588:197-1963(-)
METYAGVTSVMYISRVPSGVSLSTIMDFCGQFGNIVKSSFSGRHKHCFVQFSTTKEAQVALREIAKLQTELFSEDEPILASRFEMSTRAIASVNSESHVILVNFSNVHTPFGSREVFELFAPFGAILRILVVHDNAGVCDKALIEFESNAGARCAYEHMNNTYVWDNTLLFVQFSHHREITFRPWHKAAHTLDLSSSSASISLPITPSAGLAPAFRAEPFAPASGGARSYFKHKSCPSDSSKLDRAVPTLHFDFSNNPAFDRTFNLFNPTPSTSTSPVSNSTPRNPLQHQTLSKSTAALELSVLSHTLRRGARARTTHDSPSPKAGCVLLISNMNRHITTALNIFNVFAQFGQVVAVKLLRKKPGRALVQLVNSKQACRCTENLHNISLFGYNLSVARSHFSIITGTPDGTSHVDFHSIYAEKKIGREAGPPSPHLFVHVRCKDLDCPFPTLLDTADVAALVVKLLSGKYSKVTHIAPAGASPEPAAPGLAHSKSTSALLASSSTQFHLPRFSMHSDTSYRSSVATVVKVHPMRSTFAYEARQEPRRQSVPTVFNFHVALEDVNQTTSAIATFNATTHGSVIVFCQFF